MAASSGRDRWLTTPPVAAVTRVIGLGLILWAIAAQLQRHPVRHEGLAWALAASLTPAWMAWGSSRDRGHAGRAVAVAAIAWLGAAGGALTTFSPVALAFVGSGALGAAIAFDLPVALALAGVGPVVLAGAAALFGQPGSLLLGGIATSMAGLIVGFGRRQGAQRAEQAMLVKVEHERAELARARADVLAERNRLAREVHDVLAHTLGALAVQLEALDARIEAQAGAARTPPGTAFYRATAGVASLRDDVRRTKALAAEGLAEARRAVRALRDDADPLDAQLGRLCELRGASLAVTGSPRELEPEATLALYRVVQESLTNAAKHASGAPVGVRLRYEDAAITIAVENGMGTQPPGELARMGAGYGLDGIRERVRLLGGEVTAGPAVLARVPAGQAPAGQAPAGQGWLVEARIPA